jgi:glycosyltransferase involved in cell wall biosynthesis
VKCSVVVPVYNPGPSLARCVDSLLGQTMRADHYEVIFVDDGSTDGTGARLDALAEAHADQVRVLHIPASGWPGRPRNVGVDAARGEFVHFVDNDDALASYALEAMYDVAADTGADIVLGRPASDFRLVNYMVYRKTITGVPRRRRAAFPATRRRR